MPPLPVLVALADPTRCRIVEILRDGPQPVHVLAGSFDISRPAISRHLRVLKQARLISEKKSGRENRYALHPNRLKPVRDWLDSVAPAAKPTRPEQAAAPLAKPASRPKTVAAPKAVPAATADSIVFPLTVPAPKPAGEKPVSQMGFDF